MRDYFAMLNERDGGIGGVKINFEECETGYDTKKSIECYEQAKSKNTVIYSPVVDRRDARRDPARPYRQDPDPVDGLWPVRLGRRQHLPLGLQPAADLLGRRLDHGPPHGQRAWRHGQAQGQEARPDPSRRALSARSRSRCSRALAQEIRLRGQALSGRRGRHAEPGLALALDPARPARLPLQPGLGRDEPDRGQGGDQERLPDQQAGRRLVGRRRRRCARRRGRGQGLQVAQLPSGRQRISR